MNWPNWGAVMILAIIAGLDRTAVLQAMICRPIVAAPLTGWLLGIPQTGLEIGAMLELLWLARLPVGAAIPPDDTQVAIAATVLAAVSLPADLTGSEGGALLSVLVAMPLGKVGQLADHWARDRNLRLLLRCEQDLEHDELTRVDCWHCRGLLHFALASLITLLCIVLVGQLVVSVLSPLLVGMLHRAWPEAHLVFPLVGAAVILGSLNVSRALTLFIASFSMVTLLLWLS